MSSFPGYPKWLYHPTKEAVVVPDEAAHKALGDGWVESPADFAKAKPVEPKKHETHEHHPVVEHHKKLK